MIYLACNVILLANTDHQQEDILKLWSASSVNHCNLLEMPLSISELLGMGENSVFNFVKSMLPFNVRKEIDSCLPALFQFWDIPKVRKLLDEKINLLLFGGNFLKETYYV